MGLLEKIFGFPDIPLNPKNEIPEAGNASLADDECDNKYFIAMWQYNYALSSASNILGAILSNVEWQTYDTNGKEMKRDDYFRLNFALNQCETSAETMRKIANKLIFDRDCLLIETANKDLFVADSYTFKNGQELFLKPNTYSNVLIGNEILTRTFKDGQSAIRFTLSDKQKIDAIMANMNANFDALLKIVREGAEKAMGTKYNLQVNAQGKNTTDEKYIQKLQEIYLPLMKKANAVFLTQKGEELIDLTEKQRGSEVQQVIELSTNEIKINNEILNNVARAYGIPPAFLRGEFTEDTSGIFNLMMTFFAKPILTMMERKLSLFLLEKDAILKGARIKANVDTIRFEDVFTKASAIDKLISSGTFTINEVRKKLGEEEVKDGNDRFITKNYESLGKTGEDQ